MRSMIIVQNLKIKALKKSIKKKSFTFEVKHLLIHRDRKGVLVLRIDAYHGALFRTESLLEREQQDRRLLSLRLPVSNDSLYRAFCYEELQIMRCGAVLAFAHVMNKDKNGGRIISFGRLGVCVKLFLLKKLAACKAERESTTGNHLAPTNTPISSIRQHRPNTVYF